jgi:hypothetical protein
MAKRPYGEAANRVRVETGRGCGGRETGTNSRRAPGTHPEIVRATRPPNEALFRDRRAAQADTAGGTHPPGAALFRDRWAALVDTAGGSPPPIAAPCLDAKAWAARVWPARRVVFWRLCFRRCRVRVACSSREPYHRRPAHPTAPRRAPRTRHGEPASPAAAPAAVGCLDATAWDEQTWTPGNEL